MAATPLAPDSPLLQPLEAGALPLANRVLLASMTRNRAAADGTPTELMAEYYAQRAGAGLVITEGSQPSAVGQGYPNTPGLHTDAQQEGWRRIADAVHAAGGQLAVQVMHAGRISHTSLAGTDPVGPTDAAAEGEVFTAAGPQPFSTPRALPAEELPSVAAEFADAARRAVAAGADAVELHGANGYLLHQFLADGANTRTDAYGGSPQHRARFVVEVVRATVEAVGADRVGLRVSPGNPFNDVAEHDLSVYEVLVAELAPLGLAYLHVVADPSDEVLGRLRALWPGVLVLNTGFAEDSGRDAAEGLVASGVADAVAVGRHFIANPDLVARWERGDELAEGDAATYYGGGAEGYTTYPALARAS